MKTTIANVAAIGALSFSAFTAAQQKGFNYGSTNADGSCRVQSDFEDQFTTAKNLVGNSGFTSARLYTMIQCGTSNTPISAIQAAIDTNTQLLLGLWASAGDADFDNEISTLKAAIAQYGSAFTNLVVGISVGSEDLYRSSPQGIANNAGVGATAATIESYIAQTRSAVAGTALSGTGIGHVDTWTAWILSENAGVISAVDWLGHNGFPYFESTLSNSIDNAENLFFSSLSATEGVSQGKPVWVTETGWPISGPTENLAVASIPNAQTYWKEVGCQLFGARNTWWYTLSDSNPNQQQIAFGIAGSPPSTTPLFDISC